MSAGYLGHGEEQEMAESIVTRMRRNTGFMMAC